MNPTQTKLPPNGTEVTAMTYASDEYDRPAVEVRGILSTRYIEAMGYTQCWVGDVQVDPDTVKAVSTQVTKNAFCPTGHGGGIDPHCSPDEKGGAGQGVGWQNVHPNLVEYAHQKMFKGKMSAKKVDTVAKSVVSEHHGTENIFLGGKVNITEADLKEAIIRSIVGQHNRFAKTVKPGMEHIAIKSTSLKFNIPEDVLKQYVDRVGTTWEKSHFHQ
jgi:hypothetical protein